MPIFEPGSVVRLPFPYTDGTALQHRPALVLATIGPTEDPFLLWVLMITSAQGRVWPQDIAIPDHRAAGLPAPSVVRCAKVATVEAALAEVKGRVPGDVLEMVRQQVQAILG